MEECHDARALVGQDKLPAVQRGGGAAAEGDDRGRMSGGEDGHELITGTSWSCGTS